MDKRLDSTGNYVIEKPLPALLEGLEQLLNDPASQRNIAAIQAHVKGIEQFTDVTSPAPQHEADAAATSANARRALEDPRLKNIKI